MDCGKAIHVVGEIKDQAQYNAKSSLSDEAEAWLKEHYPNWKDPAAYWD